MTYAAPRLTVVESACAAIQGRPDLGKQSNTHTDSMKQPSIPAYEADE